MMGEWQPIETAPQDGTPILAWWKHCKTPAVTFWEYDDLWRERKWAHKAVEQGWRSEGDNCIPVNQKDCTHWMPLPAPPGAPRPAATVERAAIIEECAKVADGFTCGGCGMDGKSGAAIRALAEQPRSEGEK